MQPTFFHEHEPFHRPYDLSEVGQLTNAAVQLLRTRGVGGLSVGAIARSLNMSPQGVLNLNSRARVIELVCLGFARRWEAWTGPDRVRDLPTRLPRIERERHGVRVQRALLELARGEQVCGRPRPATLLAAMVSRERDGLAYELGRACGRRVTTDELGEVHALVTGLRLALSDPALVDVEVVPVRQELAEGRGIPGELADDLLRGQVARLVVDNQSRKGGGQDGPPEPEPGSASR